MGQRSVVIVEKSSLYYGQVRDRMRDDHVMYQSKGKTTWEEAKKSADKKAQGLGDSFRVVVVSA